ncbi:lipoprotein [Corallococcus macrosporus DSM 14697]|uniref:Lipoprotein n=2 Tax=Corallococcus macrosporus TaxID=35 RepID=A0A250JYU5_9BACT|nr:lipoprotein [Corallococcus macrosporus DSM 14697]
MQTWNKLNTMLIGLTALSLGCSSSATGSVGRRDMGHRDAYALASCTDTVSCCIQRNPGVPEACGLTAGEAAAHLAAMDAAMKRANEREDGEEDDDADEGWKEHCRDTYVLCRDAKKPRWDGDCYACFRYCEGQRQWPYEMCSRDRR